MKAEGLDYDQRMAELEEVTHPRPLAELLEPMFDLYRGNHPWVADTPLRPKSVVREMYERAMGFSDYVRHHQLARVEGIVLRYLQQRLPGPGEDVPEDAKTDELVDITEWLGEIVRQTDSSLLDEWEALRHPDEVAGAPAGHRRSRSRPRRSPPTGGPSPWRCATPCSGGWSWPRPSAGRRWASSTATTGGPAERWYEALRPYFAEYAHHRHRRRRPLAAHAPGRGAARALGRASRSWPTPRATTAGGSGPRWTWLPPTPRARSWCSVEDVGEALSPTLRRGRAPPATPLAVERSTTKSEASRLTPDPRGPMGATCSELRSSTGSGAPGRGRPAVRRRRGVRPGRRPDPRGGPCAVARPRHLLGVEQPHLHPGQRHRDAGHGQPGQGRRSATSRSRSSSPDTTALAATLSGHHPPGRVRGPGPQHRRLLRRHDLPTRPALGDQVGRVDTTGAGARHAIPLRGVASPGVG